jgi:DNA-binding beta-propeller fold protein YncE
LGGLSNEASSVTDEFPKYYSHTRNDIGTAFGAFPFTVSPDAPYIKVTTLAGLAIDRNDHGDNSLLKEPGAIAVTPAGDIYVADTEHHQIRLLSPGGSVTMFAGTGKDGYKDGPAAMAQFKEPRGIAYDISRKVLYVADTGNRRIRMIGADGMVSTIAGSG